MGRLKKKSYLITNIPVADWKRFKRWTAMEGYDNLNHALSSLIKMAGQNVLATNNLTENGLMNDHQTT
jgi:hypothetical protein|tara:strand:+ start:1148 stop:1351 length:204 start_codon:yes stop_codon:yes gene_type:complete